MQKIGSKILIVNIGSASKKYSIYEGAEELVFFHFEEGKTKTDLTIKGREEFKKDDVSLSDYEKSLEFVNNYILENYKIDIKDIYAVSFRIVAPGDYFLQDREIDKEFLKELEKSEAYASLHIKPVLEEIKKAQKIYKDQKMFGLSDSSFHKTKLEESKYYGISKKLQDEYSFKRFGYHGISAQSVVEKIQENEQGIYENIVMCHLGGGISFTALKNGKSLDNSMGFSPLEGPVMATRSGNIDFTLLRGLFTKEKIETKDKQINFLFEQSGLLGLSGLSSDLRVLKEETFKGNKDAKFAVRVYVFNIIKELVKMISVLRGVDAIIFTGTIGFRAGFMRELILEELRWLGLDFDLQKNDSGDTNSDYFYINTHDSKIKILVCETDEMQEMAKITLRLM